MKILLVTSSARGHALADALARSPQQPELITVSPQANPGLKQLSSTAYTADIMDFNRVKEIAAAHQVDWAVIGPDDPIGMGLADALAEAGIESIAPLKTCARIEASKGFTRDLLTKYQIDASPQYRVFEDDDQAALEAYISAELEGEYVVKYDALKGGKGVKVSGEHLETVKDGVKYASECIAECGRVVVEEKLIGVEFSLLSFVAGTQVVDMPAVQDHKRAYQGDTGPNTGGMGTYSDANHSLPFLTASDLAAAAEFNRLTAAALEQECGQGYRGILYGGFIATKSGVKLIEYNARFGDPEALNILPLLESDLVVIFKAMIAGELSDELVQFAPQATVCKYITPASYPVAKEERGAAVSFPDVPPNARIFYGDIAQAKDGSLQLGGSRTAGVVGIGDSIAQAEATAQSICEQVTGPVRFRADIGTAAVIEQRCATMNQLRSA